MLCFAGHLHRRKQQLGLQGIGLGVGLGVLTGIGTMGHSLGLGLGNKIFSDRRFTQFYRAAASLSEFTHNCVHSAARLPPNFSSHNIEALK